MTDQEDRDFLIWQDKSVRDWDLKDLANEYIEKYADKDEDEIIEEEEEDDDEEEEEPMRAIRT